jgi:hypothetical protein
MKTLNILVRNSRKFALLAAIGLAALTQTAQACHIELHVLAWGRDARVIPGSNTGGRVVWSSVYGCYITDQVTRGETMYAMLYPSTTLETTSPAIAWANVKTDRLNRSFSVATTPTLTYASGSFGWTGNFTVPTDVNWDDNFLQICSSSGLFRKRLPIGSRPPR